MPLIDITAKEKTTTLGENRHIRAVMKGLEKDMLKIQERGTDAIITALDARELERDEKYLPGFINTLCELQEKISMRLKENKEQHHEG